MIIEYIKEFKEERRMLYALIAFIASMILPLALYFSTGNKKIIVFFVFIIGQLYYIAKTYCELTKDISKARDLNESYPNSEKNKDKKKKESKKKKWKIAYNITKRSVRYIISAANDLLFLTTFIILAVDTFSNEIFYLFLSIVFAIIQLFLFYMKAVVNDKIINIEVIASVNKNNNHNINYLP